MRFPVFSRSKKVGKVFRNKHFLRTSYQVMTKGTIELGDITPHNIKQLKRLNQVVFPVTYNDKFYKDVLEVGELAKLAYFNDIVVGAVCCRVDTSDNKKRLYIMTLGALAPYRRLGIGERLQDHWSSGLAEGGLPRNSVARIFEGTKMLEHVLGICEKDGNYDNVFLHVQINNEGAIKFYERHGFEIVEEKKNYYKRIEPADAFVLQKTFRGDSPTKSKEEKQGWHQITSPSKPNQ